MPGLRGKRGRNTGDGNTRDETHERIDDIQAITKEKQHANDDGATEDGVGEGTAKRRAKPTKTESASRNDGQKLTTAVTTAMEKQTSGTQGRSAATELRAVTTGTGGGTLGVERNIA